MHLIYAAKIFSNYEHYMYIQNCMKRSTLLQRLQYENWTLKKQLVGLQQEYQDIQSEYKGFREAIEIRDISIPVKRHNRGAKKKQTDQSTVYYVHEYNSPIPTMHPRDISSCYSSLTQSD